MDEKLKSNLLVGFTVLIVLILFYFIIKVNFFSEGRATLIDEVKLEDGSGDPYQYLYEFYRYYNTDNFYLLDFYIAWEAKVEKLDDEGYTKVFNYTLEDAKDLCQKETNENVIEKCVQVGLR